MFNPDRSCIKDLKWKPHSKVNFQIKSSRVIEDWATFLIISVGPVTTESFLLPVPWKCCAGTSLAMPSQTSHAGTRWGQGMCFIQWQSQKIWRGAKRGGLKKTKNKTGLLWRSVHFTSLEAISYSKVRSARKLHKNRQLTIWISGFSNWRLRKDQLMTVWYSAFFKIYSFIANVYQFKILIIMSLITNNQYQPWGKHIGRSLPAKTNNYRDFTF